MITDENNTNLFFELEEFSDKVISFFDIETKQLFTDIIPRWTDLHFSERKELFPKLLLELELAIAGVLTFGLEGKTPKYGYYVNADIEQLKETLDKSDVIIGHNLMNFDYLVIDKYVSTDFINRLMDKTVDTHNLLYMKTGDFIALNDLGKMNLGMEKTEDTKIVPELWREGRHSDVKKYLRRDLDLTAGIFCYVLRYGQLDYPHKKFGKFIENRTIELDWSNLLI